MKIYTRIGFAARRRTSKTPTMENRLKEIREIMGLRPIDLARRMRIDPQQVTKLENPDRSLNLTWISRIAPALGVDPKVFLEDDPIPYLPPVGKELPTQPLICAIPSRELSELTAEDVAPPTSGKFVYFDPGLLPVSLRPRASELIAVHVDDNSMHPLIEGGNWVLVDPKKKKIEKEALTCLEVEGEAVIRLVRRGASKETFSIKISDPSAMALDKSKNDVKIIGQVVWASRPI